MDALLRRRNLWLIAFGLVHATLLWIGDVLGAYGLAGLLLGWLFFRRRDTTLLVWAGVLTELMLLLSVFALLGPALTPGDATAPDGFGTEQVAADISETSPLAAALERLLTWPLLSLSQGLVGLAVPTAILLGFWAGRRRILEEPGRHPVLLRRVALVGIGVGWLGGQELSQVDQDLRVMYTEYTLGATDLAHIMADVMRYRTTVVRALEADNKKEFDRITAGLPELRAQIQHAIDRYAAASLRVSSRSSVLGLGSPDG